MDRHRFNVYALEKSTAEKARAFARKLGVDENEIYLLESPTMEDIRTLKDVAWIAYDKPRAFLLGKLRIDAQNALLKLLEEPPEKVYFLLYECDNLLDTILSRAQRVKFKPEYETDTQLLEAIEANNAKAVLQRIIELQEMPKENLIRLLEWLAVELSRKRLYEKAALIHKQLPGFREFNLNQKLFVFALFFELLGGD